MKMIRDRELESDLLYKVFRFRCSSSVRDQIYKLNPFLNNPVRSNYYLNIFRSLILPELLRRIEYCPSVVCETGQPSNEVPPQARDEAKAILASFTDDLSVCALCCDCSATCLVTHDDCDKSLDHNDYFKIVITSSDEILAAGDPNAAFPWRAGQNDEARLRLALDIRLAQRKVEDASWAAHTLGVVRVSERFWPSLRNADFGDEPSKYRDRIIDLLVQLACGRNVDTHEHRMVSERIRVDNTNFGRWNAYVFQSGASQIDRRCSRVYFAKVAGGIFLDVYDPDAH